jgi:hypothetical protein
VEVRTQVTRPPVAVAPTASVPHPAPRTWRGRARGIERARRRTGCPREDGPGYQAESPFAATGGPRLNR